MIVPVYTVRGYYRATWGGVDLGVTEDGWTIAQVPEGQAIRSDNGADTILDGVQRGANATISGRGQEALKVQQAVYASQGGSGNATQNVGKTWRTLAQPLVLTPALDPDGRQGGPAGRPTIRAGYALMVSPAAENFNSRLDVIDVVFTLLPDENGKFWT
jgi:hypothetical protein